MKHLETNNITCSEQFGLRNEHSCESQLLVAINFSLCSPEQITSRFWYSGLLKSFEKALHTRLI